MVVVGEGGGGPPLMVVVVVVMMLVVVVTWRMPEKVGRVSARKRRRAMMRERNIVRLMVNSTIRAL